MFSVLSLFVWVGSHCVCVCVCALLCPLSSANLSHEYFPLSWKTRKDWETSTWKRLRKNNSFMQNGILDGVLEQNRLIHGKTSRIQSNAGLETLTSWIWSLLIVPSLRKMWVSGTLVDRYVKTLYFGWNISVRLKLVQSSKFNVFFFLIVWEHISHRENLSLFFQVLHGNMLYHSCNEDKYSYNSQFWEHSPNKAPEGYYQVKAINEKVPNTK